MAKHAAAHREHDRGRDDQGSGDQGSGDRDPAQDPDDRDPGAQDPDDQDPAAQDGDEQGRDETPLERLDRNWGDLLQELRVVQTGVQLLTGFLLTLPFQQRFTELTRFEQGVYLTTVVCSILATGLLVAPVALHRGLFRQHARRTMVDAAHRFAMAGTAMLAAAVTGVVLLIFDVVWGTAAGWTAAAATLLLLLGLWLVLPWRLKARLSAQEDGADVLT